MVEVFREDIPCAVLWYDCGQSGSEVQVVLHLVSCILLSAWFAWWLLFVSRMGC